MKTTALYAGSFDPLTYGHTWVIQTASKIFDKIIVAVATNPNKKYSFTKKERVQMIKDTYRFRSDIEVVSMPNVFLVKFARSLKCKFLIRGVRNFSDYEYEKTMNDVNHSMSGGIITTVVLYPPQNKSFISSSFVKGLIGLDGWRDAVKGYVPDEVFHKYIDKKYKGEIK